MPQVEAWRKVLVYPSFLESRHGQETCVSCHGGQDSESSMAAAHQGMEADPSDKCAECHAPHDLPYMNSQHARLTGYREAIKARAGLDELTPGLADMFEKNCNTCHVTCGQCHISRPHSAKKGFLRGHQVLRTPSMTENCTACHGSRIGEEFRGQHAGIPADTHYRKGMKCVACHDSQELHGYGDQGDYRYDVSNAPTCEDCHEVGSDNAYHAAHGDRLACQVCHSVSYKNCWSCHVGEGLQRPSELGFKIGRNPLKSASRPYEYSLVRHIPIAPDSYSAWDDGGLPNFSVLPTWKHATPHNIQKQTPQTADCTSSCHNNAEIFLTEADLEGATPEEVEANRDVIVTEIP